MSQNEDRGICFLLKATKSEYVESTMTRGRFCFNHPSVFNKWENKESAQADRWDGHSSIEAENLVIAPIIHDEPGKLEYGPVKKLADKAVLHLQYGVAKHSPVCCFRIVDTEVSIQNSMPFISLGEVVDRIIEEFEYDSFVLIEAVPFIERMKEKGVSLFGAVVYSDILNDCDWPLSERNKEIALQLFRKDAKYEWQKEYRFVLPPTETSPVFIELGSIEDIAISGKLTELR